MTDGEKAELAQRLLDDLDGAPFWLFAYGSLIWDPAVMVSEYRYATLPGWHRRFCMHLTGGRGTHEQPGLMLALDNGGHCDGLVFRIDGPLVDAETQFMWRREMFAGTYCPVFIEVTTPQGPVDALVFTMDHDNPRYLPDISHEQAAQRIAVAEGTLGSNFAYLDSLVRHLEELGLQDTEMQRLHTHAATLRSGSV